MARLETPRLVLRRWRDDDIMPMTAINADPDVMRWIGSGTPADRERTAAGITGCELAWDEHGFGLFAVEVRQTSELAGFAGLAIPTFLPEVMPAVEIGWRLGRPYWGPRLRHRGRPRSAALRVRRSRTRSDPQHPPDRQRRI
ncbi:GNAT family N-acetyltransferase [Micromonospora arida]|uniref:GNAT family N-acetyltransferase n=1 Tax=Micromonospora arida TaxID=2203715 RepID=UPI00340D91EC